MAHMKDVPTSILATAGTEVKTGVLSILEKKGIKMLKSSDYQLNPLYWRLVSYAGQRYLLGYSKQLEGAKAIKKLLVKSCPMEMKLPDKVVVSSHSNETFLCIQCSDKIIFLKAESKRQRDKWVEAIRTAVKEPIYYPSTVSTTSTDSSESFDVLRNLDQRLPRSVHNTADTAPRPGADWRRVNTSPAGQFQMTNRASLSSIPSSAQALAHQKRRSEEMASIMAAQSDQSSIHSLNSADRRRSSSQRELNNPGIYDEGAMYNEFGGANLEDYEVSHMKSLSLSASKSTSQPNLPVQNNPVQGKLDTKKSRHRHPGSSETKASHQDENTYYINEPAYEPIKSDDEEEYFPPPSPSDMPEDNFYMPLRDYDDRSSVSHVNNLGLESGVIYDETAAPEPPKRDYQNATIVVQAQPPEAPIDQMDSIQREKTVCLETQFQRDNQPIERDKSNDDNEKEMTKEAPNGESLRTFIQRFRSEQFRGDGFTVEVDKTDLSPETMKLVCVGDIICIAALPNAKLHNLLHVDDVIVKVNRQTLHSVDFCYTLFRTTDENKVQLHVKRVMHGILCRVILSANGDVDSLGLEFGNQSQGNEVTAIHSGGHVAKRGSPYQPRAQGVIDGGILEFSPPMNAENDLPIIETSVKFESFPTRPPAVVQQKLQDRNTASAQGTSKNPVCKIGTKRRTSVYRCPSILALVQTFLQMIIALVIILGGNPVVVAGSDIIERVTLQAGKPGMVPFQFPLPSYNISQGVPYFTLRFESQSLPFCINGKPDIMGFKSPSQLPRFTTSVTDLDTSPCVNLMIDNVDTLDEDGYVLTAVWHSLEKVWHDSVKKEIHVQIPPGPAKCFITFSENSDYHYEVHCRAPTGSGTTTLSCCQDDQRLDVKGGIIDNGLITSGIFLLPDNTHFSCCVHDVTLYVSETMCNDFVWPHVKETTSLTVNTVPTSVTTPTPQIESHTESGACRQFTLPSLWHFTYLFIYLAFVTTY